jgi:hypothetical protein
LRLGDDHWTADRWTRGYRGVDHEGDTIIGYGKAGAMQHERFGESNRNIEECLNLYMLRSDVKSAPCLWKVLCDYRKMKTRSEWSKLSLSEKEPYFCMSYKDVLHYKRYNECVDYGFTAEVNLTIFFMTCILFDADVDNLPLHKPITPFKSYVSVTPFQLFLLREKTNFPFLREQFIRDITGYVCEKLSSAIPNADDDAVIKDLLVMFAKHSTLKIEGYGRTGSKKFKVGSECSVLNKWYHQKTGERAYAGDRLGRNIVKEKVLPMNAFGSVKYLLDSATAGKNIHCFIPRGMSCQPGRPSAYARQRCQDPLNIDRKCIWAEKIEDAYKTKNEKLFKQELQILTKYITNAQGTMFCVHLFDIVQQVKGDYYQEKIEARPRTENCKKRPSFFELVPEKRRCYNDSESD